MEGVKKNEGDVRRRVVQEAIAVASAHGYDPERVDVIDGVKGDMGPSPARSRASLLHVQAAAGSGDHVLKSARQIC